ncbi:MAG: hypothetical protein HY698_05550 [Deltaproteobacteria bacterium]|nr:hypothetical protein [Deltaproteobacteria bacterium]
MLFFSLASLLSGCGGDRASQKRFPSKQDIDRLIQKPAPRFQERKVIEVDHWDLAGPFPNMVGTRTYVDSSGWGRVLKEVADAKPGVLVPTEAMHCVARELGLFYLANRSTPSEDLGDYIMGRCGSPTVGLSWQMVSGDVGGHAEEDVFRRWRGDYEEMLREQGSGNRAIGSFYGKRDGHAVVLVASAARAVHVEDTSPFPDAEGRVWLRGELLVPAESIDALVNQGHYRVAPCSVDASVSLPRFAVACPTSPEDQRAWIELAAFPSGRVLGRTVLQVLAWPNKAPTSQYVNETYTAPRSLAVGEDKTAALLELINQARATAGLAAVSLSTKQSVTATRVAPHFFAALFGDEQETVADTVVLGLQAGWDIEGLVKKGMFTYGLTFQADDLARMIDRVVARPRGRKVLLDPEITQMAIGPLDVADRPVLASVFSGYVLFGQEDNNKNAHLVRERLNKLRAEKNLPPLGVLASVQAKANAAAAQVAKGAKNPSQVFDDLLRESARIIEDGVTGWVFYASSLEDYEFPAKFVELKSGRIAISVAQFRADDEPWGQHVIFVVID